MFKSIRNIFIRLGTIGSQTRALESIAHARGFSVPSGLFHIGATADYWHAAIIATAARNGGE